MEISEQIFNRIVDEARRSKGWLKFVGIMMIIVGAFQALSIVGIIIAWIPIWMGVLLVQAGNAADRLAQSMDSSQIAELLSKLRIYFLLQGVLIIIGLLMVFLVIILYLIFGLALLGGILGSMGTSNY